MPALRALCKPAPNALSRPPALQLKYPWAPAETHPQQLLHSLPSMNSIRKTETRLVM
jgi:hypothetical protein